MCAAMEGRVIKSWTAFVVAAVAVWSWVGVAMGARVREVGVQEGARGGRIVIQADGSIGFRVVGKGRVVVVRLGEVEGVGRVGKVSGRGLVRSVKVRRVGRGAEVVVKTSAAVRPLPVYDSLSHTLVVELVPVAKRGRSSRVVGVVKRVRLGVHGGFTRVVVEASSRLSASYSRKGSVGLMRVMARAAEGLRLPEPRGIINSIHLISSSPFTLKLGLTQQAGAHRLFYLQAGRKLVLDILKGTKLASPKPSVPRRAGGHPSPAKPKAPTAGPHPPKPGEKRPPAEIARRPRPAKVLPPAGEQIRAKLPPPTASQLIRARQLLKAAREDMKAGRYSQALRRLRAIVSYYANTPQVADATYLLADALFYMNRKRMAQAYEEVMHHYQKALDLYPDSKLKPHALLMMGKAALLAGEAFRASGYFELVAEDYPKTEYVPQALISLAEAQAKQEKLAEAMETYRKVIRDYPTSAYRKQAEWGLAKLMFKLGRYRRVAVLLEEMMVRYPTWYLKNPDALYYLGEAYYQLRDYPKARRYLMWAYNLMPELHEKDIVLTRIGDTYNFEGHYAVAREIYEYVANHFPGTDGALVARIRMAETPQKDPEHPWGLFQVRAEAHALDVYMDIAKRYPDREVAQLARVKIAVYYYKQKDFSKAIDTLIKLLRDHPDTSFRKEVLYTLNISVVGLLRKLRAENEPVKLLEAFLRYKQWLARPDGNEELSLLAWAYERCGLSGRAARLYQTLVARGLKDPQLRLAWGRCLLAEGQAAEAAEVLKALDMRELGPEERAEAVGLLGRALVGSRQYAQGLAKLLELRTAMPQALGIAELEAIATAAEAVGRYRLAHQVMAELDQRLAGAGGHEQQRFVLAMRAGAVAVAMGDFDLAVKDYRHALALARRNADKAWASYELARAMGRRGQSKQMLAVLKKVKTMNVAPWSQMAEGVINDYALAKDLARVGE